MLSISIVIYQLDAEVFKKLLDSLYVALTKTIGIDQKIKITIIDNGKQAAEISTLIGNDQTDSCNFEVISNNKNIGYGRAHNIGIRISDAKYHLILNPDVILDENSLKEGLLYLENNPDICAVAPSANDEHGEQQFLSKNYPGVFDLLLRGVAPLVIKNYFVKRLHRYELRDIVTGGKPAQVEIISGCFMLCRTSALRKINGFDERYFLYFEDFALSMELQKLGKIYYLPAMKIIHYGGNAARKGILHIFMFLYSGIKFFNQFGWKLL